MRAVFGGTISRDKDPAIGFISITLSRKFNYSQINNNQYVVVDVHSSDIC